MLILLFETRKYRKKLFKAPEDEEAYRFEIGGGHWIFGGDPAILRYIKSLTPVKTYKRKSAVYFSKQDLYVPYPIQNHLSYLGKKTATQAIGEIINAPEGTPRTMGEWLEKSFGKTLMDIFFAPFPRVIHCWLMDRYCSTGRVQVPCEP